MRFCFSLLFLAINILGCGGEQKEVTLSTETPASLTEGSYHETDTGLKYADIVTGEGKVAEEGDYVKVHYSGWLENGKRFDTSLLRQGGPRPFEFQLGAGRVIAGWEEGVTGMKVGGIRQLVIPPALGYGERGAGGVIPPNASLIFDVQLLDVSDQPF